MKSIAARLLSILCICWVGISSVKAQEARPLRVLTYNIQFLPGFAIHIKHFPHKRAKYIAEAIINDSIDIVVFQEMFDKRGRHILERELKERFPYMVGPRKNKPKGWKRGTGVMMMSRYPLKPLEKIKFSDCKSIDCLANKGVIGVEVAYPQQTFQLFGTHLQAFSVGNVMQSQLDEFGELLKKYETTNIPQLSAGDFNIRSTDTTLYPYMLKAMQSEDGAFSSEIKYTSDHRTNDMNPYETDIEDQLDYILYKANGKEPKSLKREVRVYRKRWCKRNQDLSDHFAVLMEVGW